KLSQGRIAILPNPVSTSVNQKAKSSGFRSWLWIALLRRGRQRRIEIRCIHVNVVRLGIERHCLGSEFGFDGFDETEFVGCVFMKYMNDPFACRRKNLPCLRIVNIGVHAVSNWERLADNLPGVRVHDDE